MKVFSEKSEGIVPMSLPPEVEGRLRAMARRVNSIIVLRGVLATLAVALLATLLVMAADATILIVDTRVRWLLTGLAAVATAAAAWHALVLPLRRGRVTPQRMARILETRHPEMQERISSALELLGQGGEAASQASRQLIDLLAKGALSDVRGVKAKSEFAGRTVRPAVSAVAISTAILGVIFLAWPREGRLLFARAVAPSLSLPNLHALGLAVEPGDTSCLRGAPLSIRLSDGRSAGEPAEILISRESSPETRERMQKVPGAAGFPLHEIIIPSVDAPFDYRIVCGNGVTRKYSVKVFEPPAVSSCVVSVEPPAYTGRQTYSIENGMADIAGMAGSRVSVSASFSTPCDAMLVMGGGALPPLQSADGGASARWSFVLSESSRGEWGIALRDAAGHTNRADRALIRVEKDSPPEITLSSPVEPELRLPPHGKLSLKYSIVEDIGLIATNLYVRREPSGAIERLPVPLSTASPGRWYGSAEVDLSDMNLAGVGALRVWLTAMDNLPRELNGPQSATSREILVHLDQHAQRQEVQKRKGAMDAARTSFAEAATRLDAAAAATEKLIPRLGDPAATDSAVEELRKGPLGDAVKAERELRRIANAVEGLGLPPAAEEALRKAIADSVRPARKALEVVALAPEEDRAALADSAVEALRSAAEETRRLIDRMEAFDKARSLADSMEDMAARQRKAAADLERNPHDKAAMQAYEQAQRELSQRLPGLVNADGESRKEELGAVAGELRAKAAELRGRATEQRLQADLAKRLADESGRDAAEGELREHAGAAFAADAARVKKAAEGLSAPTEQMADAARMAQDAAALAAEAAEQQRRGAARKAREGFEKAMRMANAATDAARDAVEDAREAAKQARRDGVPRADEIAERVEEASLQVDEAARLAAEASELASEALRKPEAERAPLLDSAAERAERAAQVARLAAENALLARKELEGVGETYELLYAEMGSEALEAARAAAMAEAMARQAASQPDFETIPPPEEPAMQAGQPDAGDAAGSSSESAATADDGAAPQDGAPQAAAAQDGATQAAAPQSPEQVMKALEDRLADYAEQARRDVAEAEHSAQALDNGQSYMTSAQDMLWHSMQDARAAIEKLGEANYSEAAYRQQMAAEHLDMAAAQMEQAADRMDAANPAPQDRPSDAPAYTDGASDDDGLTAGDAREIAANMADAEQALRDLGADLDSMTPQERAAAESAATAEAAAVMASDAAGDAIDAAYKATEMLDRVGDAQTIAEATAVAAEAAQKAQEAAKAVEAAALARDAARKAEEAKEAHEAAAGNAEAAQSVGRAADMLGDLSRQVAERVEQALQAQPDAIADAARHAAELQGAADEAVKAAAESAESSRLAERALAGTADNAQGDTAGNASEAADAVSALAGKTAEAVDFARRAAEAETAAERIELLQDAAESAAEARELAQAAAEEAQRAREEAARREQAAREAAESAARNTVPEERAQALADAARNAVAAASEAYPADSDSSGLPQSAVDALDMARQAGEFAKNALGSLDESGRDGDDRARWDGLDQAIEGSRVAGNLAREAGAMAAQASENAWRETLDLASDAARGAAGALEAAKKAEAAADKAEQISRRDGAEPTEEQRGMLSQAKEAAQLAGKAAEQVGGALPQSGEAIKNLNDDEKAARRDSADAAAATAREARRLADSAARTARALQPESDDAGENAARRAAAAARDNAELLSGAAETAARRASGELNANDPNADKSGKQGESDSGSSDQDAPSDGGNQEDPENASRNKHVEGTDIELELETIIRGFPASEWARIKGLRGSASLEEVLSRVPPDYRELVRRYFLALSEEAARDEAAGK